MTDTLATKQDLRELEAATRDGIQAAETRMEKRFTAIDARFASIDARFVAIDARFDNLERHFDLRLDEFEKRMEIRFARIEHDMDTRMATRADLIDLERRMTMRLGGIIVAGIGIFSALVRLA
jgi:hypothetical protein